MIKVIAFDLDDTLYNATWLANKSRLGGLLKMQEKGLKIIDMENAIELLNQIVKRLGSNSPLHFNTFLIELKERTDIVEDTNYSIPKYVACGVWGYHAIKVRYLKPYREVMGSLEKIKGLGYQLAIFSNGIPVKQYEKLVRMDLANLFDYIFISQEINIEKPSHDFFYYCFKEMGVSAEEVMYIGDRLDTDIKPANELGMISVLIHRGGKYDPNIKKNKIDRITEPNYEIHSLNELTKIIKKHAKKA
jgi:putative hydrolase of the HAD superfamily